MSHSMDTNLMIDAQARIITELRSSLNRALKENEEARYYKQEALFYRELVSAIAEVPSLQLAWVDLISLLTISGVQNKNLVGK